VASGLWSRAAGRCGAGPCVRLPLRGQLSLAASRHAPRRREGEPARRRCGACAAARRAACPTGAATPHPAALGSALTHPHITTDFSESQLELITGVHADVDACLASSPRSTSSSTARCGGDEMLWVGSMPCGLPADETIPIGVLRHQPTWRAPRACTAWAWATATAGACRRSRHPLQLVAAGAGRRRLLRADPQLPPPRFCCCTCLARRRRCATASSRAASTAAAAVAKGHTLHLPHATSAAHGAAGLPERRPGHAGGELQQPASYGASLQDALTRPIRPTRRWASATRAASTTSWPPRCCRSRTSSTARSGPSA
jgi:hypothetical protein